jgi:Domain of unknown function (DUF5134)
VTGPTWLLDGLAVVMITTAVYCAAHLVASWITQRDGERDIDLMHVAMGIAMGGTLVAVFDQRWNGPWVFAFVLFAAWFGMRGIRPFVTPGAARGGGGWHLHHLLACVAMVYMFVGFSAPMAAGASTAHQSMAAMGAASPAATQPSTTALVLAAGLLCCAGWNVAELVIAGHPRRGVGALDAGRHVLAPRLAICCQLVMSVTTGYLLLAA